MAELKGFSGTTVEGCPWSGTWMLDNFGRRLYPVVSVWAEHGNKQLNREDLLVMLAALDEAALFSGTPQETVPVGFLNAPNDDGLRGPWTEEDEAALAAGRVPFSYDETPPIGWSPHSPSPHMLLNNPPAGTGFYQVTDGVEAPEPDEAPDETPRNDDMDAAYRVD